MSETELPKQIDPLQLADKNTELEGSFELKEMKRLSELLFDKHGDVTFRLQFGKDEEGFRLVTGKISSRIKVICQRCLEPLLLELDLNVRLSPVLSNEEARRLPKIYDPLLVEEGQVSLLDLIEDELLVNVPSFPKHNMAECSIKLNDLLENKTKKQQNNDNPFHILEKLIKKR